MDHKDETYWINRRLVRAGDDYYSVDSDEGCVRTFNRHEDAVAWCEASGESYHV